MTPNRRAALYLAVVGGLGMAIAAHGCTAFSGAEELLGQGGAGGGGTTAVTTSSSSSGAGGGGGEGLVGLPCNGPANDECSVPAEGCGCVDCIESALCNPGACNTDGSCDEDLTDSCVCPDCDGNYYCSLSSCNEDGTCSPFTESCACVDCFDYPECTDNAALCQQGVSDGICQTDESCDCVDCIGVMRCVPCNDADPTCSVEEGCHCNDCAPLEACDLCDGDGRCWAPEEACDCADCMNEPECQGAGGGTTSSGSAGGV